MPKSQQRGIERERIVEHLRARPGERASDVARAFDVHPSTADYHLRRLARQGHIARVRAGRDIHHYPTGEGFCQRAREVHARLTEAGRSLLRLGLDRTVFPRQAIVEQGFTSSAVRWAIDRLIEAGAIERLAWGIYELAPAWHPCVAAALREAPCRSCNEAAGEPYTRRATSSPSPSGRIELSRSG